MPYMRGMVNANNQAGPTSRRQTVTTPTLSDLALLVIAVVSVIALFHGFG